MTIPSAPATATGPVNATAGGYSPASVNLPGQQQSTDPNAPANPPELTDEQKTVRQKLVDLIRIKNPYQFSHDGILTLPGLPIPLAGLTEQLATLRIGSEATLRQMYIRVTKLPLKKTGADSLKPFGYDLFDRRHLHFRAGHQRPGAVELHHRPGRRTEGAAVRQAKSHPEADGRSRRPHPVAGPRPDLRRRSTIHQREVEIESRVERQMIGVHASVSMGDTRSIRVFVLGEVKRPGTYTISGLATMTSALYAAGGVKPIGSLRNIQLKRQGALVRRLDLYDMLIRGDTE